MSSRHRLLAAPLLFAPLLASSAAGATFTRITDTRTTAPGSSSLFTQLDEPAHRDGITVFRAVRDGGRPAIYSKAPGEGVRLVADFYGDVLGRGYFTNFGSSPDTSLGAIVFFGSGSLSLLSDIPFQGIYVSAGGVLTKVADTSTAVPGEMFSFSSFGTGPRIRTGRVAFVGRGGGRAAIYLWNGGHLQRIVDSTMTMPGSAQNFWNFDDIDLDGEDVVFRARSGSNFGGIYRWRAGVVTRLMDQSQARPDGQGLFGLPWPRFAVQDGTLVFACDSGMYLKQGEQFVRALDTRMSIPAGTERFSTLYPQVETGGGAAVLGAAAGSQLGMFLANGGSVWTVRTNTAPLDGRPIYNMLWSAQSLHNESMALRVDFLDGSKGVYLVGDVRVPVGTWLRPNQAVRVAGTGGYQALRYNYDTGASSATEYIPAPAPFGVEMPRGQWTGSYLYDYGSGAFTQAVYSFAHQLP